MHFFNLRNIIIMGSSLILTALCISPELYNMFPIWVIRLGLGIADTMFHEVGHSLFAWLFGMPSIPSIFTIFGREHASGMAMTFERSWFIQIGAYIALAAACHWIYHNGRHLFWYLAGFSALIFIMSFTRFTELAFVYMGHGSSILMGGFFLYRAWLDLDARNDYERWLNALFGYYLLLNNIFFGYQLAYDKYFLADYAGRNIPSAGSHDFVKVADTFSIWNIEGVGIFTLFLGIIVMLASTALAYYITWRDGLYALDDA